MKSSKMMCSKRRLNAIKYYRGYHIANGHVATCDIGLYHLVIGWHILKTPIRSAIFHMLNHTKLLQSNVVEPKTKCYTLICINQ